MSAQQASEVMFLLHRGELTLKEIASHVGVAEWAVAEASRAAFRRKERA